MNRLLALGVFIIPITHALLAQTVPLSGVVNTYHKVLSINNVCQTEIVLDARGLLPGQRLLFYQAQGAEINLSNSSSFGTITNLNNAGRYELATIADTLGNAKYKLVAPLLTNWDVAASGFQVIALPYIPANAVVSGSVLAAPYQSGTGLGGVLALDVPGTLRLDSNLVASFCGFKGGSGVSNQTNNCSWLLTNDNFSYELGTWRAANKGEGIARFVLNHECGRGPQANGGGGGNDHNSGGGGGGNSTRGARAGQNNEPNALGCDGTHEGEGGYGLNYPDRLFFGGGGGAGHANNGPHANGGNGGGLIFVRAGKIIAAGGQILNKGADGAEGLGDGAGGGGAGGTTLLILTDTAGAHQVIVQAQGGAGGNTNNVNNNRCFGPGGGGAGGVLFTNAHVAINQVGGTAGRITQSTNGCNNGTGGAEGGSAGTRQAIQKVVENITPALPPALQDLPNQMSICVGETSYITVQAVAVDVFQWQVQDGATWKPFSSSDSLSGGTSAQITIGAFTVPGMYRLRCIGSSSTTCFTPDTSNIVQLVVLARPTAAFGSVITGTQVQFQNFSTDYSSLLWNFGDGNTSTVTHPSHQYLPGQYQCTLTVFGVCDTVSFSQNLVILISPSANFTIVDTLLGCNTVTLNLQPSNIYAGHSYTWFTPGGTPVTSTNAMHNPVYAQSGVYPIRLIAANGSQRDTLVRQIVVQIEHLPQAQIGYTVMGTSGTVVFSNQSIGGSVYFWNFGDGTQSTSTDSLVTHTYAQSGTYLVTLAASNACGASVVQLDLILQVVGVEEAEGGKLELYPNPASGQVWVKTTNATPIPQRVMLYDLLGRRVLRDDLRSDVHLLHLNGLAPGTYLLQTDTGVSLRLLIF